MNKFSVRYINGLTYDDEQIYFISAYIYAVMVYDCKTKKVEILEDFPKEVQLVGAFEKIIKCNRKIYLFPCFAEDIYCYDLDKNEYYELNVLSTVIDKMDRRKVLNVLVNNERIYCICRCPNMIICIDSKTDDFQIHMMPQGLLREEISTDKTFFSALLKDNHLLFPYMNNAVIEFSLEQNIFRVNYMDEILEEPTDNMHEYISQMCVDHNDIIWMCDISGQVFKVVNNKRIKINMPDDFIGTYNDRFHVQPGINKMLMVGNELCFILRSACKILKYNIDTQKFLWCDNNLAQWNDEGRQIAFLYDAQIDNQTFLLYNKNDDAIYKWNHKKGFIEKVGFEISIDTLCNSKFDKGCLFSIVERKNDLIGYILYIKRNYGNSIQGKSIKCGEKIYYDLL